MKTTKQINRKIKRIKLRFDELNAPNPIPLSKELEEELYELFGMLKALMWVKQNS